MLHVQNSLLAAGAAGRDPRLRRLLAALPPGSLEVSGTRRPRSVFGRRLGDYGGAHHANDVLRIRLALRHGGIHLDTDTFVARPLDALRGHPVALGWSPGQYMASQLLMAKPGATFLRLYLETYRVGHSPGRRRHPLA